MPCIASMAVALVLYFPFFHPLIQPGPRQRGLMAWVSYREL